MDSLSTSPHRRASFEFDCIDADYVDGAGPRLLDGFRAEQTKPFALMRVVTTPARFGHFAGATPAPADWFYLEIERDGSGLPAWHAQLEGNGYSAHARGVLTYARQLDTPDETRGPRSRPQTLGAAAAPRLGLPRSLVTACAPLPKPATRAAISTVLKRVPQAASVLVRDVGQANFVSLCDDRGRAILHFDVGFPISFNRHTFPSNFDVNRSEAPPIVLSHWDWDHLHGAFHLPHLLECRWIVPNQRLGPGAARLARILAQKGNLLVRPANARIRFPFGELVRSRGPARDLNDSGLTILATLTSGRSALLTGDADYAYLMHANATKVDHLVATHHGARFNADAASVPMPNNRHGQLVISYGYRNVYRHPHAEALSKHANWGWTTCLTTAGRRGVASRGDRIVN
ncbi:metallo-hydrolase/oxidoreductase [Bradyrhizobium sp. USDA 3650]